MWIFDKGGVKSDLKLSALDQTLHPCALCPSKSWFCSCSTRYYDGLAKVLLILQTAVTDFCSVCSCHLILLITALTSSDRRHKELNSLKGEELAISAGRRKLCFCLKALYV